MAVWKREVVDGKIRYSLNEEHPLLREMLGDEDGEENRPGLVCLSLLATRSLQISISPMPPVMAVDFGPATDHPLNL